MPPKMLNQLVSKLGLESSFTDTHPSRLCVKVAFFLT